MKRLVLVHGINQQDKDPDAVKEAWVDALARGAGKNAAWAKQISKTALFPYYGNTLAGYAAGVSDKDIQAFAQGTGDAPDSEDAKLAEFAGAILVDMALKAGVDPTEIEAEEKAVPQGALHQIAFRKIAGLLLKLSPAKGALAVSFIKQAHAYLKNPNATKAIDAHVSPALASAEETVLVTHSLGTAVTFHVLRALEAQGKEMNIPLYVTLGSPLSMDPFIRFYPLPRKQPDGVRHWLNGADPGDLVALYGALTKNNLGPANIENIVNLNNGNAHPHNISGKTGYLTQPLIAKRIVEALEA